MYKQQRPMVENILLNEKKAKVIIDSKIKGNTLEAASAKLWYYYSTCR